MYPLCVCVCVIYLSISVKKDIMISTCCYVLPSFSPYSVCIVLLQIFVSLDNLVFLIMIKYYTILYYYITL